MRIHGDLVHRVQKNHPRASTILKLPDPRESGGLLPRSGLRSNCRMDTSSFAVPLRRRARQPFRRPPSTAFGPATDRPVCAQGATVEAIADIRTRRRPWRKPSASLADHREPTVPTRAAAEASAASYALNSVSRLSTAWRRVRSSAISCSLVFGWASPQHSQPQPQGSFASVTSVMAEQPQPQLCVSFSVIVIRQR